MWNLPGPGIEPFSLHRQVNSYPLFYRGSSPVVLDVGRPKARSMDSFWHIISLARLADVRNQVIFAVRQEYVELGDQLLLLQSGDEIAVIPPISGGKDMNEVEEKSKDIIKFTSEKLSVDEVSQLVISPLCGAISLFVGTTRNNFEGKKVISLEYEAYLPMAENEIRKICSDIRQKWPVKHIAVFHRLGLVPVTEASVIIAVSSAHRAASLEAVSYAIDALKARVPIWKKEIYEESSSSWKRNKECFWATSV
ncbi:hypothetical protein JEQ12_006868 [Ovis aries]|uniref:Molybdopterin synthase catalytic subunit n=1 Tax=Ovis aries TaxID=9940 RepID=A0A835ZRH6_SHEEP|nr:hypothetical protein JEQ12_006868 [Ovis aries]